VQKRAARERLTQDRSRRTPDWPLVFPPVMRGTVRR
jgi:hypothetical protein